MTISTTKARPRYQNRPTPDKSALISHKNLDSVTLGDRENAGPKLIPNGMVMAKKIASKPKSQNPEFIPPDEQQAWREKLGDEPIGKGENTPERVSHLKDLLRKHELVNLPEDGEFELLTEGVVKGAQLRRGVPETGVFDITTREALLTGPKRDPLHLTPAEKAKWNESFGDKTLRRGANNKKNVESLQMFINERELENLVVDGDFGRQTEQALKAAQLRHGLEPNGVFDQQTRTKLLDATKKIVDTRVSHKQALAKIQEVLRAEHHRFGGQTMTESGRIIKRGNREYESGFDKRIGDYWKSIGLNFDGDDRNVPWSAAFISFAHKMAGVGDQFKAGPAHAAYIRDSIFAMKEGRKDAAYLGHRSTERAPQVGDLIGRARQGGVNYDNQPSSYKSHTDLVVEVGPGFVKMIGGNVGNSVTEVTLSTDENGLINNTSKYFVVMEPNHLVGNEFKPPEEIPIG